MWELSHLVNMLETSELLPSVLPIKTYIGVTFFKSIAKEYFLVV